MSDLDHPLMRRFRERSPEIFAHALRVVSLAERAAEAVGADRILTRVGALFHDVGKVDDPDVAGTKEGAEGTVSLERRAKHIGTGVQLARQHGVPEEIVSFIREHHGTMKLEQRAGSPAEVARFAGPRPSCLESAIVMIANRVEHQSRGLSLSPEAAENLVERVLVDLSTQFQFAGSGVTQTQLQQIQGALVAYLKSR